jgi:hypothetical protein
MSLDIITANENGLGLFDTSTEKAGNILSVQLGSLEYQQSLGIDLAYFLDEDFSFQNASFKAYLVERLAQSGINVSAVTEVVESLYKQFLFEVEAEETSSALIAR